MHKCYHSTLYDHQFHRNFKFNFWRVFVTWLNVGTVHLALRQCLTRRRDFKGMLYVLRAGGTRGVFVPTPHILADSLILLQPGKADYAHHITNCPLPRIFRPSDSSAC